MENTFTSFSPPPDAPFTAMFMVCWDQFGEAYGIYLVIPWKLDPEFCGTAVNDQQTRKGASGFY
jgi:hypothetical protein